MFLLRVILSLSSSTCMFFSSIHVLQLSLPLPVEAFVHHHHQRRLFTLNSPLYHHKSTSSLSSSSLSYNGENQQTYTVHVSHENQNATLTIHESESILHALERTKAQINNDSNSDDSFLSSLPDLPKDCRKGNCLTCAASHLPHSNQNSVKTLDDGLAPVMRDMVDREGYVQTCSSYVTGDDVFLELGKCHDVWDAVNSSRGFLNSAEAERIRHEAMAKTMRMADENNVIKWAKKTQKMLDHS